MALTDPATIQDRDILGADGGKLGKVETVFLDAANRQAGVGRDQHRLLRPEGLAGSASAATETGDGTCKCRSTRTPVKGSPHHEPDQALSEQDEIELFEYYGIPCGGETVTATGAPRARLQATGFADEQRTQPDTRGAGQDVSGPNTDDAMTRSEERLHVGTERVEAGRAGCASTSSPRT